MDGFREVRAIHDESTIRVYQAYNATIADAAVAANSFKAPLESGSWSDTRMTWIKPSAVWMGYRSGWSCMKDKNQERILALDLSRERFEALLLNARLSHGGPSQKCRDGTVVVQWDPERAMDPGAEPKQVFTKACPGIRSIQIGLRGAAVQLLLSPEFVVRISDVTTDFRAAADALADGDVDRATKSLWRHRRESRVDVPPELRVALRMDDTEAEAHAPGCRNMDTEGLDTSG